MNCVNLSWGWFYCHVKLTSLCTTDQKKRGSFSASILGFKWATRGKNRSHLSVMLQALMRRSQSAHFYLPRWLLIHKPAISINKSHISPFMKAYFPLNKTIALFHEIIMIPDYKFPSTVFPIVFWLVTNAIQTSRLMQSLLVPSLQVTYF